MSQMRKPRCPSRSKDPPKATQPTGCQAGALFRLGGHFHCPPRREREGDAVSPRLRPSGAVRGRVPPGCEVQCTPTDAAVIGEEPAVRRDTCAPRGWPLRPGRDPWLRKAACGRHQGHSRLLRSGSSLIHPSALLPVNHIPTSRQSGPCHLA